MKILTIILIIMSSLMQNVSANNPYKPGDKASDFSLVNVDGSSVSLSDFKDAKGFIVIFTCNHCPYAIAYEDRIIAIDQEYKSKGYPVIAINPNDPDVVPQDSFENMKKRYQEKSFTFPYLFDEQQSVFPEYGAQRTPHVFLLNKENGDLIVKYIGAIDDNYKDANSVKKEYLADAVDALLNNQEPDINFTKAIGCSIKVK